MLAVAEKIEERDILTPKMREAQAAIELPEIQEIAKTLARYNLGIFMPHMHNEQTGDFLDPQDDIVSVEDGLRVSFHKDEELKAQGKSFVDVGWQWVDNGMASRMACTRRCVQQGTQHTSGHDSSIAA